MKQSIMSSTTSLTFVAAIVLQCALHAVADPLPQPPTLASRQYSAVVYQGCFQSSSGLEFNSTYLYNTKGYCQDQCAPAGYTFEATTNKTDCWCGNSIPPTSALVSDSYCNDPCAGYTAEMCGSANAVYFSVYDTGLSDDSSSTTSSASTKSASSTTSSKPSVVTLGGQTVVVTATGAAASGSKSSGPSKAGIAAGVVVGLVAFGAIAGGIFFFIRNRRRRQVEETFRRNAAISSFVSAGKSPTSSGGASISDNRLDPVLANRRMSDGSIADNQDYSRRILKVTNA